MSGPTPPTGPVLTEEELATLSDEELIQLIQQRTGETYGGASEVLINFRGGPPPGESMDATPPLSRKELATMSEDELVALLMARTGMPEHIAMPRVAIMKHGYDPDDPVTLAS